MSLTKQSWCSKQAAFVNVMALLFVLAGANAAPANTTVSVSLGTVSEGSADDTDHDGVWDSWQPPHLELLAYNGLPSGYNYHAVLEFDTISIPSGSFVNSATFRVRYDFSSGSPGDTLQFNSYVGDGVVTFADCAVDNQIGPVYDAHGPTPPPYYMIPATSFVQSLVDSHSRYAGFMIENISKNQTAFKPTNSQTPLADRPALLVTYTLAPEPSTFVLLGIGAISLFGYAWRRRPQAT
jgi:hypothetical protein